MKRYLLIFVFLLSGLLFACGEEEGEGAERTYQLYYVNMDGNGITPEEYKAHSPSQDTVKNIEELLKKLQTAGGDGNYKSPLQAGEDIPDFQLKETQLSVHFSAAYSGRDVLEEILARAAIVKTLCQVQGVDYVEFYVEDQPLMLSGSSVGLMNEDSFLEGLNEDTFEQRKEVILYFADSSGKKLREVTTEMTYNAAQPLAKMLVEKLIAGPEMLVEKEPELLPVIPENTVLNSVTIRDNICYLDFSGAFEELSGAVSSDVAVYAIVNTLCELPNVNKVQFTIEGEQQDTYGDTEHFTSPFERNLDIVVPETQEQRKQ